MSDLAPQAMNAVPDKPRSFGYKCQWLAIRTEETAAVADSIFLRNVRPCNWAEGIAGAYERKVFVSPPVSGWTFVVGNILPGVGNPDGPDWLPDRCTPLIAHLSRRFEEVQYFGTHRIVGYHAWAKAERGRIVRVYAYLGEQGVTLWNRGEQTPEEHALGFNFLESADETEDIPFEDLGGTLPDEESVMQIAGKWSIDPQSLDGLDIETGLGIIGDLGPTFYRLNSGRLTLREYQRMAPGMAGLVGWAAKLIGRPIETASYAPEPGSYLFLDYADLPSYARQEIDPHLARALKRCPNVLLVHTVPMIGRNEGLGVYLLNDGGTIVTVITFARSRHGAVPAQQCLVLLITPLEGDELVVTAAGRSGFDVRVGVHLEVLADASVDQLWERHQIRIDGARGRITRIPTTESSLVDFLRRIERADFRYKLDRGLYAEISQDEVNRIRATG